MKTIRLKPNGIPKEDISFPAFQFNEIVNQNWEESDLYNLLEQKKFLFVMYKMDVKNDSDFNKMSPEEQKRHLILYKVTLWNAPAVDIDQKAQITWNLTQKIIKK